MGRIHTRDTTTEHRSSFIRRDLVRDLGHEAVLSTPEVGIPAVGLVAVWPFGVESICGVLADVLHA